MTPSVRDSTTITLDTNRIREMRYDPPTKVVHTKRSIEGFEGLSWTLRVVRVHGPAIRVTFAISKDSVKAVVTCTVGPHIKQLESTFDEGKEYTVFDDLSTDYLDDLFILQMEVEFDIPKLYSKSLCLSVSDFVADSLQDVEFNLADGKVSANRGFLSFISPVFNAMFAHDTKEAQTGVIGIKEFDVTTVTNIMDFCYGQNLDGKPTSEVIAMLMFADKYDIKTVVKRLEEFIISDIVNDNFRVIAQYAWDLDRNDLKTACAEHFRQNPCLCLTPEFVTMGPSVQLGLLAAAASIDFFEQ